MVRFGAAVQDEDHRDSQAATKAKDLIMKFLGQPTAVERSRDCKMVAGPLRVLFAPRDLQPCASGVVL